MPLENSPPFPHNVSNGKPLNNQDIPQNRRCKWSFFFARTSKNPRPSNVWASSAEPWLRGGVFSPFSLTPLSLSILNTSSSSLESFLARHNPLSASAPKMKAENLPNQIHLFCRLIIMVALSCFIHSVIFISWSRANEDTNNVISVKLLKSATVETP